MSGQMIRASTSWRLRREIKNKFMFRGRIWVDGQDFAVVRMEGEPSQKPLVVDEAKCHPRHLLKR